MIEKTIKELLSYAKSHLALDAEDEVYFKNILLHLFKKETPYEGEIDEKRISSLEVPDSLIQEIIDYETKEEGMTSEEAFLKADFVLGLLSPTPSKVNEKFFELAKKNDLAALDYLYELSIHNGYFQKTKVEQNLEWDASFKDGPSLKITINLSKPEKNNKDIAKLLTKVSSDYPKCRLCHDNLGFYGDTKHPARSTIRFVPLTLANEKWYLQYSPYGYFAKHCICFKDEHVPMKIEHQTFVRLLDFVDLFPSFFMGSNSDLPIVGGSILDHEHFQGGLPCLPIFQAKNKEEVFLSSKGSKVSILDFYVSALRIEGKDKEDVISLADSILDKWLPYNDIENDIIGNENGVRHNALTLISEKKGDVYNLYLLLRNNRTNEEYPDGIFHAHPEYFAIKKEGIGLIEAAGLFILPARLKRQIEEAKQSALMPKEEYLAKFPDMKDFEGMISAIQNGETAESYINSVCQNILRNVAVFKDNEKGHAGFHKFLKGVFGE